MHFEQNTEFMNIRPGDTYGKSYVVKGQWRKCNLKSSWRLLTTFYCIHNIWSSYHNNINVTKNSLLAWRYEFQNPGRGKVYFSSPKCPDRLWVPHSPIRNGGYGSLAGARRWGVKVTIQLYPVTRSIASGGVYLLLLYVFMVWIGTPLTLPLPHFICCFLNVLFNTGV